MPHGVRAPGCPATPPPAAREAQPHLGLLRCSRRGRRRGRPGRGARLHCARAGQHSTGQGRKAGVRGCGRSDSLSAGRLHVPFPAGGRSDRTAARSFPRSDSLCAGRLHVPFPAGGRSDSLCAGRLHVPFPRRRAQAPCMWARSESACRRTGAPSCAPPAMPALRQTPTQARTRLRRRHWPQALALHVPFAFLALADRPAVLARGVAAFFRRPCVSPAAVRPGPRTTVVLVRAVLRRLAGAQLVQGLGGVAGWHTAEARVRLCVHGGRGGCVCGEGGGPHTPGQRDGYKGLPLLYPKQTRVAAS